MTKEYKEWLTGGALWALGSILIVSDFTSESNVLLFTGVGIIFANCIHQCKDVWCK